MPSDFKTYRGSDGNAEKVVHTSPFAFKFGSETDQMTAEFFESYVKYKDLKKNQLV